jgi:hypothetical protein
MFRPLSACLEDSNRAKISHRPLRAGGLEPTGEAVADVVVDQRLLGAFDRAFHRLQLLRDF